MWTEGQGREPSHGFSELLRIRTLELFKMQTKPFSQATDGSLRPPEHLADFPCRIPLQAKLGNRPLRRREFGEDLLDGFHHDGGLLRRRFASDRILPRQAFKPRLRRDLALDVAAVRLVIPGPIGALSQSDHREQAPEAVQSLAGQRCIAIADSYTQTVRHPQDRPYAANERPDAREPKRPDGR